MPNHRMTSGMIARCGTLRNICMLESNKVSGGRQMPLTTPRMKPIEPPINRPSRARSVLISVLAMRVPSRTLCPNATATALGADASPQIGADFKFVAPAAVERSHPVLTHRIHAREHALGRSNGFIIEMTDEPVGRPPSFGRGFSDDDMEPDAEAHAPALGKCGFV